jgi:hypothetical protein
MGFVMYSAVCEGSVNIIWHGAAMCAYTVAVGFHQWSFKIHFWDISCVCVCWVVLAALTSLSILLHVHLIRAHHTEESVTEFLWPHF